MQDYILIYLSIHCLFISGCGLNSIEDKHESLVPVGDVTVVGVSPKVYIGERIGFLLKDIKAEETELHNGKLETKFKENGGAGLACAVSEDGYFLTAYHCVKETNNLRLVSSQEVNKLLEATVIWHSEEYDLALIKAEVGTIPFPISSSAKQGSPCFCGGGISGSCSAGKIEKVARKAEFFKIIHNAPLMGGDSGGPLITYEGLLVGINGKVFTELTIGLFYYNIARKSKASMVNINILEKIINQDRAKAL